MSHFLGIQHLMDGKTLPMITQESPDRQIQQQPTAVQSGFQTTDESMSPHLRDDHQVKFSSPKLLRNLSPQDTHQTNKICQPRTICAVNFDDDLRFENCSVVERALFAVNHQDACNGSSPNSDLINKFKLELQREMNTLKQKRSKLQLLQQTHWQESELEAIKPSLKRLKRKKVKAAKKYTPKRRRKVAISEDSSYSVTQYETTSNKSSVDESVKMIDTGRDPQYDPLSLSETSEHCPTCICNGVISDRKLIMCDGKDCQDIERWFHARCVGLNKGQFSRLSNDMSAKWYCPECVYKFNQNQNQANRQVFGQDVGQIKDSQNGSQNSLTKNNEMADLTLSVQYSACNEKSLEMNIDLIQSPNELTFPSATLSDGSEIQNGLAASEDQKNQAFQSQDSVVSIEEAQFGQLVCSQETLQIDSDSHSADSVVFVTEGVNQAQRHEYLNGVNRRSKAIKKDLKVSPTMRDKLSRILHTQPCSNAEWKRLGRAILTCARYGLAFKGLDISQW